MNFKSKTAGSLLVVFSIIGILIVPSVTNGQITTTIATTLKLTQLHLL